MDVHDLFCNAWGVPSEKQVEMVKSIGSYLRCIRNDLRLMYFDGGYWIEDDLDCICHWLAAILKILKYFGIIGTKQK